MSNLAITPKSLPLGNQAIWIAVTLGVNPGSARTSSWGVDDVWF